MKKLEMNEMEIVEGGKFWGSETYFGDCVNGAQTVTVMYFVLWAGFITDSYTQGC